MSTPPPEKRGLKTKTRPKIKGYIPAWTGPIEGYAVNAIRRFYPKLCAAYEFEDLLQEAYIKYLACVRSYSGKVDNGAWFMSLFKCALNNHLTGLVQRHARYSFVEFRGVLSLEQASTYGGEGDGADELTILNLMKSLPSELLVELIECLKAHGNVVPEKTGQKLKAFILQQGPA